MPITNKSADSPPEQYYTTAHRDYDWGWTTELVTNAGTDGRGKTIRLVEIADGYHADYQTGRYASGGALTLTPAEFQKQVGLGLIQATPEADHDIRLTRDFSFPVILDNEAIYGKVVPLVEKYRAEGGLAVCKPLNGGLGTRLVVRGKRPEATAVFNQIVSEFEAAIGGGK